MGKSDLKPNDEDSVRGTRITTLEKGGRISWNAHDHRIMTQFLVRNSLGPEEVRQMQPPTDDKGMAIWPFTPGCQRLKDLAAELKCVKTERYNKAVHKRIASALKYKVDLWNGEKRPPFRWLSAEEQEGGGPTVEYHPWAKKWAERTWDGDMLPPEESEDGVTAA